MIPNFKPFRMNEKYRKKNNSLTLILSNINELNDFNRLEVKMQHSQQTINIYIKLS